MAGIRADIDLSVNTQGVKRSLDKATNEINKVVNKISGKNIGFSVNEKSFTQPLGRINASANEFTKSLEASNARVIAFGASVAILDGISNSFKGLVREAVKFEKTLADINVVLNLSNAQLRQFGEGLFDTARKTAQGFNMASEAALEFSRQGLSTEEVLRRTNDALILTRLTSLKAADAVAGLTAAVNAFGGAGLTTTDIIDKLAAVDVKFAVSSEDLINALQRAGAVAIDAGVEFDSLIGLVAALQQTTARGGAVIGNSLKTIFTRIQRPESLRQLEEMGIAIRDISGAVLPADRILLNMSKTFDRLTQAQQSNVVQFSAGIFQANVFRAALRDLAKEQSLQVQATQVAANAAGEAAMKNELLNKTVAALASQAGTNIQELGAILGNLALGPQLADALEFVNKRIEEIRGALGGGEDEGSTFAKGLVRGIGNVISGPAAIAFGAIFIKLFVNIAKFASNSMKDVLGVVSQKDKIKQMEESIVEALSRNQHIQQSLNNLGDDRLAQEKFLLGIIEQQTAAIREQRSLAAALAGPLVQKGVSPNITSSGGLIPEDSKRAERKGAARGGYTAGAIDSMNVAGLGDVVYNKAETVKQFPGMKQPAIMPPQDSKAGSVYQQAFQEKHGFNPYANGGFIPNFATLVGKKLVMDKAKLGLFGGSMDIARATGVNYKEIEKLFASGQPLKMSASLKDIIMSSDSGKQKISGKETLFEAFSALSGAGVHSIERMFNIRPPVPGRRGQGKLSQDQFAERKSLNLLNKELGGHQLTYDPKTKKGVSSYPVDIIGPGAHEVKSGRLSAANLISKSLRMASDRELSGWMAANKISGGKGLQGKNLKEAQRLAGKLGIKGSGQAGAFTEADADVWSMSEGFVPSFAKLQTTPKNNKILDGRTTYQFPNGTLFKPSGGQGISQQRIKGQLLSTSGKVKKNNISIPRSKLEDSSVKKLKGPAFNARAGRGFEVLVGGAIYKGVKPSTTGNFDFRQSPVLPIDSEVNFNNLISGGSILSDAHAGKGHGTKLLMKKFINDRLLDHFKFTYLPGSGFNDYIKAEAPSNFVEFIGKGPDKEMGKIGSMQLYRSGNMDYTEALLRNQNFLSSLPPRFRKDKIAPDMLRLYANQDQVNVANQGFIPNFRYWKKHIQFSRGMDGGWGIKGDTSHLDWFIDYLESSGKHSSREIQKLKSQLKTVTDKRYKEIQDLGYPSMGREGAQYYSAKRRIHERPEMLSLKGVFLKNLKDEIHGYNDENNSRFSSGFVPNFARKKSTTKELIDPATGTKLKYREDQPGGYAEILHSVRGEKDLKGGAFNNFNQLVSQYDSIGSGMLTPQRAGFGPTAWSKVVTMFPQIKNRIQNGLQTRGDFTVDMTEIPFESLVGLKRKVTSAFKADPNMDVFLTQYGSSPFFDEGVLFENLTTRKVKGKGDADAKFKNLGFVPNFANIVPFDNTVPFKKKTIRSKNLMHQEYLKAYSEGENQFKPGQTMLQFLSQFYDRKTLQDLRKYPEDYRILSGGFVPNFSNPLKDAIEREKAAGIPASNIRVEQSNQLRGPGNPMGLAVTNTRDEPAGVGQGIRRAKSMGLDPKSHGAAGGFLPNFQGAGVKNIKFKEGVSKEVQDEYKKHAEALKKSTNAIDQNSQSNMESLQRLFYLQSGISMANGFLQQFAEEGDGATKKIAELGMSVSNVVSTMIALKEFSSMLVGFSGQPDKAVGLGGLFGKVGKAGPMKGLTNTLGIGKISKVVGRIGDIGKGLLRFAPVVGQVTMGLTILHETLKAFDINVFDLFKDNADRAADKLEKLSESAEKTQSALDEANNLSATRDKMSKLEILGSRRTLKQEKELISLKIKEIKQQTSLQSKISQVDTAHLKNKNLINEINKVKSGEIKGTEAMVRVLEKIAKQEAVQAAFATAIKDFSKKTEDEFGFVDTFGKGDAPSDELKPELQKLANTIAEITVGLAPERKQAMKESLAAGNIQGISGLESLDLETAEKKQFFIKVLNEQIEVSERQIETNKKAQEAQAGALNEYVKIVANYKKQTEQIAHQNNLDNIISASKRKINSSLIDLQSEYQMISRSTSIQNKTALEAAAITKKLDSDKLKANNEALNGLEKLRDQYMNAGKIASRFNSEAKDAEAGVAEFKKAITTGLSPQKIEGLSDVLGKQTPAQVQAINSFFAELGEEVKDLNDNQVIVNKLAKKYGDTQDANLRQAIILLMHNMELTNISQENIEVLKKINYTLKRSNETAETTAKAARDGLENETALNLIKQKTVEGARELAAFMSEQADPAQAILRNLRGEADTLAVINHFQKNRIQTLMSSGDLDQKAYEVQVEKNRTDAEAALLSLKQLQVQENILRGTDEFKTIQIAKIQSEVLGASAAAKDAAFRNEYLSYNQTRESLVQSQIKEENTTLETTARNNLTKLKLLAGSEELKKQVDLQIQEEITSAQSSALINSEKALILSSMGEQGRLLQKANELQESSNKLIELQNAIRKAAISKEELRLSVGTDLAIEQLGASRSTRESAMRATLTESPEDVLAFAQSLKETNKLLGEGSRAFDTLRIKLAEMDVTAKNLGADLVEIGLDQTRSGMKQLFKDIGSGAKSAKEAWKDFGLGLADVLLDRMMEHNIDQIIKNLTFAFTGENALSEADKIAGSNNKLIGSLDALAGKVEAQKKAVEQDVANRADIASKAGTSDHKISDPNFTTERGAQINRGLQFKAPSDPRIEKLKILAKAEELSHAKEAEINAHKSKILAKELNQTAEQTSASTAELVSELNATNAKIEEATKNLNFYKPHMRFGSIEIPTAEPNRGFKGISNRPGNKNRPGNEFFGGRIQKFAKGGFVEGEPGVDKVPAMLTAGEFVVPKKAAKALKDGGMLQYFEEGGVAERVKAGAQGLAQGFVMQEAARYVAKKMQDKDLHKDKPPTFNMDKFKNLNLNSTVSIARGNPKSSGKLLAKDPVMEEYRQHLLDVASYRAAQKNKKVSERMSKIGSIVGTVASFAVSQLTSLAAKPLNAIFEKGKNLALGNSGLGDHSKAFKAARKAGYKVDYSTIANSIDSGKPFNYKNKLISYDPSQGFTEIPNSTTVNNPNYNFKETGVRKNMGGPIPAMLTAGESFIPAPIAKRIGYDNLNKMNRTGSLPIVKGPGGIDNVGPVGLSEGDFIIRRSSTDKLLRENPNMMRFAMQNPDGFRKAEKGYYQGGIVGTSSSPSSPVSAPQKTSGAKPAPVVENRISSLLEGTQANQKETVATNQNTEVTNNINVNVTIDKSGNEKVSTEGAQGTYEQEQQLAMKIKTKVLEVIREEKRIGGELSG